MTQTNGALTRTQQNTATTFANLVATNQKAIKKIASKSIDLSRLYRLILSQVRQNPSLATCSADSILLAMQQASEVGLEPGTALGLAYLVPFKGECQFIIGYRGYIEMFRRSGMGLFVDANVVYEGDEFDVRQGLHPDLVHVPKFGKRTPDKILYAYAVARYKDGSAQFEVLTREDLLATKGRSAAGDRGPWSTDFAAMCKKTAIRRLAKLLPLAIDIRRAVEIEEKSEEAIEATFAPDAESGEDTPFDDITEGNGALPGMSEANPAPANAGQTAKAIAN